jgi:hypothetical protein
MKKRNSYNIMPLEVAHSSFVYVCVCGEGGGGGGGGARGRGRHKTRLPAQTHGLQFHPLQICLLWPKFFVVPEPS